MKQKFQPYLDNIARYFKKSKRHSIGVDIGSNSIKLVELEKKNGTIKLKNYAVLRIQEDLTRGEIRKFSGEMIDKVLNDLSIKDKTVNLAIPSYSSLITLIEVSSQTEEEIRKEIELEAGKYIPVDLEDVVYDWQIVKTDILEEKLKEKGVKKNKENFVSEGENLVQSKVLLISVMRNVSNEYEKSFDKNRLKVESIEVDCFSTQRSLLKGQKGNYLIMDIGGKVTNFIGVCKGQLLFNRNVDLAGNKLTELIAKTLNVNNNRAETMKVKQGFDSDSKAVVANVLDPFCDSLIEQAEKNLNEFEEFKNVDLDKIVLTGGTSKLKGLKECIQDKMKTEVVYGNPWSGIDYPKEIKDKILSSAPFFGVAVGLALIDLE